MLQDAFIQGGPFIRLVVLKIKNNFDCKILENQAP